MPPPPLENPHIYDHPALLTFLNNKTVIVTIVRIATYRRQCHKKNKKQRTAGTNLIIILPLWRENGIAFRMPKKQPTYHSVTHCF